MRNNLSFYSPILFHNFSRVKVVPLLIGINVGVFLIIHIIPNLPWVSLLGLVPSLVLSKFMLWQFFTYMFVHVGVMHLAINMLMLWFFAPTVESAWGRKRFLFYYFFTGIGAGLCSFLFSGSSHAVVIGASGAIFGVLVAYAVMYPESTILLFFFFPMKMKHAILVLGGINLLGALSSPGSGIAYFAHLGGALFGYIYLKRELLFFKFFHSLFLLKEWLIKRKGHKKRISQDKMKKEVDRILDKIAKYGIGSLTKEERRFLQLKSKDYFD
ncbi:MAG: rhomboid family intramembrane serine protease [Candidatus Omnitrophota bacterium]|nr:MAG: rhomboid family intramembrane serine protease [Candidatus Omnitrophota bacterium]HDN85611.1 rhomboid family intramembrane serine protease [Candidatus Omnitrophota bacterium]